MRNHDQALIAAAKSGNLHGVQAALAAGADVHGRTCYAFFKAAEHGHLAVVECLLAAGADANTYGGEPLVWASAWGHMEVVECLLNAGAKISSSALGLAAKHGQVPIIQLLRNRGMRLNPLLDRLHTFLPEAQVALLASGRLSRRTSAKYAAQGVCPDALFVLLERTGNTALAAMLKATRLLDPLSPEERAALLRDLLAKSTEPENGHVAAR